MVANGNRATVREVYDRLLEMQQQDAKWREETTGTLSRIDERLVNAVRRIDGNEKRMDDHDDDHEVLEVRLDKADLRDKLWGGINSAIATVAAVLAGTRN